jgi:hypothetical protein
MPKEIWSFLPDARTGNTADTQKEEMRERLIALKEELCRVSPEALEEIEREAIIRKDC